MRYVLSFALLLGITLAARPDDAAKAEALLTLAKLQRERDQEHVTAETATAAAMLMLEKTKREREAAVSTTPAPECGCNFGEPCECRTCPCAESAKPSWPVWSTEVEAKRQPTVVFVGTPARPIAGAIVCQQTMLPGADTHCIVVAVPNAKLGRMDWAKTLPATATDADIRHAARLEVQPVTAVPFPSSRIALAVADADVMLVVRERRR